MFELSGAAVGALASLLESVRPNTSGLAPQAARLERAQEVRDRLVTVQALRAVLAAVEAEAMQDLHEATAGVSADLGHELAQPRDRAARPAERRWCGETLVSVQDEVALAMDVSPRTAAAWLTRSHLLLTRFPTLLAALRAGRLPAHAGWQIVQVLRELSQPDSDTMVVEALLGWGERYGWSRIRAKAREFAARAEPLIAGAWHEQAVETRRVSMTPLPDGMAQLELIASAVEVAAAYSAVANTAARLIRDGDERTADQLRTDLALHRLTGGTDGTDGAPVEGSTGAVATVVIHATAADVWAVADPVTGASAAAQLAGYGPLPHSAFADALRTARLRYHLTDRTPISHPDRHDPSPGLMVHVRDRDRTCRFPGCPQPADRADLDHRVPFGPPVSDQAEGATSEANLHVLCRAHHRLKHHGGWHVQPDPDGGQTWTDPTGRAYRRPPPDADLTGLHAPPETLLPGGTLHPHDLPDYATDTGWTYTLAV